MAAKNPSPLQRILKILNGGFNFHRDLPKLPSPTAARVVTTEERDHLLELSQRSVPRQADNVMHNGFLLHAQSVIQQVSHDKIENDRIIEMAPEISQAASIMIPSILSPNDLKRTAIQITSNCSDLTPERNEAVSKLVTDFFEEKLALSSKVPGWIEQALYRAGSQPLLILPLTTLEKQLTQGPHVITSQESLEQRIKILDEKSIYGIGDKITPVSENHVIATEAFVERSLSEIFENVASSTPTRTDVRRNASRKLIENILSQEALMVIDNPDSLQFGHQRNEDAKNKITKTTKLRYRESSMLALPAPDEKDTKSPLDNPLFMTLPPESVIPVYTPGAPADHIGYFIVLNEYGHPIEITPQMSDSIQMHHSYAGGQPIFQQLFQAYGMSDFGDANMRAQLAMAHLYQNIVESHLKDRLTNAGFAHVGLGRDNDVYRYMFSRYLQQRRTKLLFVPKEFLTYFCFKINEQGIGESKLNELKFILSLRITLMVCRMLVAFNNAIDRKRIDINFGQNFTGNILEHMRTIQREAMRKSAVTFTHDPMSIAQQVVNKSTTIKAIGIPGIPEYTISNESNQRQDVSPDTELSEDLKNLIILKLDVPAAAMNNLSDAEYSRSVVTTNIFFSRTTLAKQIIVIGHLDNVVHTYTRYSSELIEKLKALIVTSTHEDSVTPEGAINKIDQAVLENVIKGLHVTLPAPNVAPDKAQFDVLESMLSNIDGIVSSVLNDDLANGDQDVGTVITALRGLAKSNLVKRYVQDFGFTDLNLPGLEEFNQKELLDLRQMFLNFAKGLAEQKAAISPGDTAGPSQPDYGGTDAASGMPSDFGTTADASNQQSF